MNPETEFDPSVREQAGDGILTGAFLPLLMLSLSLLILLISQLTTLSSQRASIQAVLQRQTDSVIQSRKVQDSLQKFAVDLIELGKTDKEARTIVDKYGIRQQNPGLPAAESK
jgi:hypothetical protein